MKGVVLAGGLGTRFHPVTTVVNKHLLDVFDEPMIFYPLRKLAAAGLTEVVLVTGAEIDQFKRLLGDGSSLGLNLSYTQQEGELGIAHALARAEEFVDNEAVAVILGDNIYQEDLAPQVAAYMSNPPGARVLLKEVATEEAKRFAVAYLDENAKIESIVEKPSEPRSRLAVTGFYLLDRNVFDVIRGLEPSARGEYEITDVLNVYAERGDLGYDLLKGWWTDAGTPPSKLKASILIALEKGVTFHA